MQRLRSEHGVPLGALFVNRVPNFAISGERLPKELLREILATMLPVAVPPSGEA